MINSHVDSTQTITHVSLCAGYGGIDLGLSRVLPTLRTIAFSEIEAFACANLVAKMEEGLLDLAPVWTDLKTFPWFHFRNKVDVLSGGFPCFEAGTLVTSERGLVPIEDIRVGDRVLTHLGRWRRVVFAQTKTAQSGVLKCGIGNIRCTPDHRFFAKRKLGAGNPGNFGSREWKEASALDRRDLVGTVLPGVTTARESSDLLWLVGRYIADGHVVDRKNRVDSGRVVFSIGNGKVEEFRKRLSAAGYSGTEVQEQGCIKFHVVRNDLFRRCRQYGRGSHEKQLLSVDLCRDEEQSRALLDGYLSGDGHRREGRFRCITVSKRLAIGLVYLAYRAGRQNASVRFQSKPSKHIILGREVNQSSYWVVDFYDTTRSGHMEGDYLWRQFKSYELGDVTTVYDIGVEEDESFHADGIIVHNCQPFSTAGNRNTDDDPRHLFPFIREGIRIMRPGVVFLENVEGIISAKLKGRRWRDKEGTPVLLHVLRELERLGYRATAGVFSASEVGAPHQRKRVFILGIREDLADGIGAGLQRHAGDGHARCQPGRVGAEEGSAGRSNSGGTTVADPRRSSGAEGIQPSELRTTRAGESSGSSRVLSRSGEAEEVPSRRDGQSELENAGDSRRERVGERSGDSIEERPADPQPRVRGKSEVGFERPSWPSRPRQLQFGWEPPRTVAADARGERRQQNSGSTSGDEAADGGEGWNECEPNSDHQSSGESQSGVRDVADRNGIVRGSSAEGREHDSEVGPAGEEQNNWKIKSEVGRDFDESSDRMDYAELQISCDNRTDELRLLGNGVVPLTASRAFVTLYCELIPAAIK